MTAARSALAAPEPIKRAALVVRVSTTRQAETEEGSLTNQLQRLRSHISYKRDACGEPWLEAAVYELRGISGKHSLRSPEFARLFADIRSGRVNTLLCTSLDRICRTVSDFLSFFELLAEHQVEFVCLKQHYDTTTPQGKLFVTIMMALAEFEREQTAERNREATAARSERGLWNGGRLLGYDPDPQHKARLVVNEAEAALVQAAFQRYLACGSLKETAAGLNARGYRSKAYTSRWGQPHPGSAFRLTTVQYLLKNPAYIGKKEINKTARGKLTPPGKAYRLVDAVWPAIIDPALFEEVQRLLASNGRTKHNGALATRHTYLLAGIADCGRCATALEGRSGTGRQGTVYFYYVCKKPSCGLRVTAGEAEAAVLARIGTLAQNSGLVERLVAETNARLRRRAPALARQERALRRQLDEAKATGSKLLDDWVAGKETSRQIVDEKLAAVAQRRSQLEHGLQEIGDQLAGIRRNAVTARAVQAALTEVHALYGALQPHEQKELVSLIVRRAQVGDKEIVLEINGGVCAWAGETPGRLAPGVGFSQLPHRLRDQDSNLEPIG